VSTAIEEAQISRGRYYQLETRALMAMLHALEPESVNSSEEASPLRRLALLEAKLRRLEQSKRRAQRLLYLTSKLKAAGTRGKRIGSTPAGSAPSPSSAKGRTATALHPELGGKEP
jgi:hypothetical protein